MVGRTGRGFLSACSCLWPALSPGVPNHGPATRVGPGLRPGPERPGVELLVRSQSDVGRTYADFCHPACDLWPLLVWRVALEVPQGTGGARTRMRTGRATPPNVPGRSPARYNMCPLLLDRAGSAPSRRAVPRDPAADRARGPPVGLGTRG